TGTRVAGGVERHPGPCLGVGLIPARGRRPPPPPPAILAGYIAAAGAVRSTSDFWTSAEERPSAARALEFIEPWSTPSRYHGIPEFHRGLASGRRAQHRAKKPWSIPTIEHD